MANQQPTQTLANLPPSGQANPCDFPGVQDVLRRLQLNVNEVNKAENFSAFMKANMSWLNHLPKTDTTNTTEGDTALFLAWNPKSNQLQVIVGTSIASITGMSGDEKARVSSNDTTTDFLVNKIVADGTSTATVTEADDGANETLEIGSGITVQAVTDNTTGTSAGSLEATSDTVADDNFATIIQKLIDAGVWT